MLQFLAIRDFALIDRLEVEFAPGLNLLTGETGSGKSILIDAVAQLIGDRASLDLIRAGSDSASIQGIFRVESEHPAIRLLAGQEIAVEGQEIVIRRVISPTGSKVFVNGVLSTQRFLAQLGTSLADIHGQHDRHGLLQSRAQLDYLDVFAGNQSLRSGVSRAHRRLARIRGSLAELKTSDRARLEEMEEIRFQLGKLEQLGLRPGLGRELENERRLLATADTRARCSLSAHQILYEGEPSVLSLLSRAEQEAARLAELDAAQGVLAEQIGDARLQLTEISYTLRDHGQAIQLDPDRLEKTEARISTLQRARRRYQRHSAQELIEVRNELRERLEILLDSDSRKEELAAREEHLHGTFQRRATRLSAKRSKAGSELASRAESELRTLAMEKCRFNVVVGAAEPGPRGINSVAFHLSTNPGEDPRPISQIASGGELSRIALALKSIANVDEFSKTLIFDEIDAGIGGRTASAVASQLAGVSRNHQVLCVTHLPQIAARADQHFHVGKVQAEGRTEVRVSKLGQPQRRRELARMLAGDQVSEITLAQAAELLERGNATSNSTIS